MELDKYYKRLMIIALITLLLCAFILIIIHNSRSYNKIVYLDKCERLAADSVIITDNNTYYLTYNDCSAAPQKILINKVLFIER